jgi:hypothetical protein
VEVEENYQLYISNKFPTFENLDDDDDDDDDDMDISGAWEGIRII